MKRSLLHAIAVLLGTSPVFGAPEPDRVIPYKGVGDAQLTLHVFNPPGHRVEDARPAIVFFFGGGWNRGGPEQFHRQSAHLASRGMVAICADYRTRDRHGTSPDACVRDGKSALRWVRAHAAELGIDPNRIAAGGGSAGGHVAAATAMLEGFNEPGEDTATSSRPDALVLFNPVIDNGPVGYGHDRVKDYWRDFSPLHNIRAGAPATLLLLGTEDRLVPVATAEDFSARMLEAGVRCELVLYEGQPHGFFNRAKFNETLAEMDRFLVSLGFLEVEFEEDGPLPLAKGKRLYAADLSEPCSVDGWRMEGPGKVEFKDGWMHMFSPGEAMHHVFWCPEDFPARFIAEWEAQNVDAEWGLCIVFFSATGASGEDIFDPALPQRDGGFMQYVRGAINSYHISYYANVPHEPDRGRANLRKNNMFALLQSGREGVPTRSDKVHRIRLVKQDGHIRMYVDDRKVIDHKDDGVSHGPVYGEGKIGFRQMQWTHFRYRNFRVWELKEQPEERP
jgi:acetyl esterase